MLSINDHPDIRVSTHSRPKAAGKNNIADCLSFVVSTHSRPKAAGVITFALFRDIDCFNTQPPEGGWYPNVRFWIQGYGFNTQPPEGGWQRPHYKCKCHKRFNTQPPEGGWSHIISYLLFDFLFQHTAARRRLGG